jgi:arsenate reductase
MTDNPAKKKRVLIVCTGNSARSQMAEGLLRHLAGEQVEVLSAGTRPAGVNPHAVRAMAELGIDISRQRSKSVDEFAGQQFDWVITVCDHAREVCPVFPGGGERVHHSFEDPASAPEEQKPEAFRRVRDALGKWLAELAKKM